MLRDLEIVCSKLQLPVEEFELKRLSHYVDMVMKWNKIVNLTGSRESSEFVLKHIVDGLAIVPHLNTEDKIMDVGSGCGIPGVVLGVMFPAKEVILLEPRSRRARFLEQVRIELGLSEVNVLKGKIEDVGLRLSLAGYTLVTRAFGKMTQFGNMVQPFIGGISRIYFLKSEVKEDEIKEAERILGASEVINLTVPGYLKRSLILFDNLNAG